LPLVPLQDPHRVVVRFACKQKPEDAAWQVMEVNRAVARLKGYAGS